jgi:putative ATP-binding cassette transporter
MRLIRFLTTHAPWMLPGAVLAGLAGGAVSTALLFVINTGLDRSRSTSNTLFLLFIGLAGLGMITRATSALLLTQIGQGAMLQLRLQISRQILGVPLRRLEEIGTPRLLAVVTDDILNILNAVSNVPLICVNVASILTCLIFLGWLSWQLFLIVVALIVMVMVTTQLLNGMATREFMAARQAHNRVMAALRGLITGIKELKVHRPRRAAFVEDLEGSATTFRRHTVAAMRIYVLGATWGEMLSFTTIGLLVFLVPRLMTVPDSTLTTFVLVLLYSMEPLQFILNQAPQYSRGVVALRSLESVGLTLTQSGLDLTLETAGAPVASWRRLDLRGVVFSYVREEGNTPFVLGPIDLSCSPGELLFITGGNGSGKTTLGKLLLGLYSPESGEIAVDDRRVTDADREEYRQLFSAVFADFFLFDRLLGVEPAGLDERATAYLRQLQLDRKVQVTNGVLSTQDLSQGQRKRLALLAAYLEDRPIFLFDEWAADQDPAFKDLFYREFLPELKARGKTVFVISHDDRYYDIADRVIKLDDGRLVEDRRLRPAPALARLTGPDEKLAVSAF